MPAGIATVDHAESRGLDPARRPVRHGAASREERGSQASGCAAQRTRGVSFPAAGILTRSGLASASLRPGPGGPAAARRLRRAGRDTRGPGRLHPNRRTGGAGLRDPARAPPRPRGLVTRNPAADAHPLPRRSEAGAGAPFSQDGDGTPDRDAPQADPGRHPRGPRPVRGGGADRVLTIRPPPRGLPGGLDRLRDDARRHRTGERRGLQPARRGRSVASRRSVLTRSVAPRGTSPGATTLP